MTLNFTRDNEAGESYSYISYETIHDMLVDTKPSAYDYAFDYLVSLEVLQAEFAYLYVQSVYYSLSFSLSLGLGVSCG